MQGIKKSIAIASIGTMIEYYDYSIFSLFLPFLSPTFFAANSSYAALSIGFYAILISSVARPLGGLFFGSIGDRYGRKKALLFSLYGIALATLAMGIMPGFAQIGHFAAISIIVIRAIQMFCYGGEYSGAGIYVVELVAHRKSGLIGAILSSMALFGSVCASLVGLFLTYLNKDVPNWRLAFIFGGLVGLVTLFLRHGMTETLEGSNLQQNDYSIITIIKKFPRQVLVTSFVGGLITLPFTSIVVFINPILKAKGIINSFQLMLIQFTISIVAVAALIIAGRLADKFTPYKIMCGATIGLFLIAMPFAQIVQSHQQLIWIILAEIIVIIINESLLGPSNAYFKDIFPPRARYRGVAFSFCLGMSVIGGLTPVIDNYLYKQSASMVSSAYWLMLVCIITLFTLRLENNHLKETLVKSYAK